MPTDGSEAPRLNRPSTILSRADHLEEIWESRVGRALRRVGLKSVRTTILTLAVLATLIPALATSWISYRQNGRAIEAKLREELTASAGQSAREVGLWLKERTYDLRVFAASYEVIEGIERGGGSRRLPEYLSSVNERFPDYEQLMVVAPDRRTVASSGRTPGRLNFTGDWLQQARLGDPVLGDPQRADSTSPITMEVAVPIVSASGRFLGVFAGRLRFRGIEASLTALKPTDEGRVIVTRPDGQVIASIGARVAALPEATLRRLTRADSGTTTYEAPDGVAMVGAMTDVPRSDWKVIASVPAAAAFAEIGILRNTTFALVLVLLLVVFALAYGLGLLIVLPLERLSVAADRVAGGDLEVDVLPASGGGEISQLTSVFNDMVRRLREGRNALETLSVTDALTGLANRRRLTTELEREVHRSERSGRPFAVLMLDVDRFKAFNDTYGHPAGDAVLKRLARLLRESAREVDTVARYGGEEFLLVLPETDAATAAIVAERIRASAEGERFEPVEGAAPVTVSVSVGYALFPQHGQTPETIVEAADKALYRSKEGGRNRVTAAEGGAPPSPDSPRARRRKGT